MILEFLAAHGAMLKEIAGDAAIVVTGASLVTGFTSTPAPGSLRGKIYRGIELAGLVTKRAKETGLLEAADPETEARFTQVVELVRSVIGPPAPTTVATPAAPAAPAPDAAAAAPAAS